MMNKHNISLIEMYVDISNQDYKYGKGYLEKNDIYHIKF